MPIPFALLLDAASDAPARLNALEAAAKSAQSAGDNAWMLTSAALVLLMTGPGLRFSMAGWRGARMCSPP
jgi:Amt family ammonium transporter